METLASPFCGSLQRLKRRRQYERLESVVTTRNDVQILRLDGGSVQKSWKINGMIPKWQLKITSPIKVSKWFRDAYVDMMLRLAANVAQLNNGNLFFSQDYSGSSTDLCFTGDPMTKKLSGEPDRTPPPPSPIPDEWQHMIPPERAPLAPSPA